MAFPGNRDVTEDWIAHAHSWIRESGEAFASIKYLYNSPPMNFALLTSPDQLRQVIQVCPDGAELTLYRRARLPVRGSLTPRLIEEVQTAIPEQAECVCLFTASGLSTDPRLEGDSWRSRSEMVAELGDRMGEPVAIGGWPGHDVERIQFAKGGIDGPR